MARNRYGAEKRQRELGREQKKEEKRQRKLDRKNAREESKSDHPESPAAEPEG
ncbi:MAG TPA: hypothetical protein VH680_03200 [Gemmatimonadales bacterium]